MNYIGSKHKLSPFIENSIKSVAGKDLSDKIFCDIFAGTGIIGRIFKSKVRQVISNDFEYYSYVLIRNYIGNHFSLNYQYYIDVLNELEGIEGFIFQNYCLGSGSGRQYFSDRNGKRIDSIRQKIEDWKTNKEINSDLYFFLLASLLETADKLANTASVYGAFLKKLKKTAKKKLKLEPAYFEINDNFHKVYNEDGNTLIDKIEGDILYLDPPYNTRQYGANYHILNTIAKYDEFIPKGKTGLRDYQRSKYCRQSTVAYEFNDLIKKTKFKYIFLSYNNEGLMSEQKVRNIMKQYGKYGLIEKDYRRFKADRTENRNHKADSTTEFLHILEKNS